MRARTRQARAALRHRYLLRVPEGKALMSAFATEDKRAIALRLIASGQWRAARWAAASHIVYNDSLGLTPDGQLVKRPAPKRQVAELLSVRDAAAIAGVHPATIRRWVKAGRLTVVQSPEARPIIRRSELEHLLQTQGRGC